jgi:predicted phage terminase large subunit-like protein
MAALMYVDYPDYNAIIFRRTFTDLSLPSALMDVSKQWLTDTPARWNELKKIWYFPSGATISFGYLDNQNAKYRYQGSEFHYVGMDEVSQIDKLSYLYLFSRLRKQARDAAIPLRMFAASNPPQVDSGMWVYDRFIEDSTPRHSLDPETKKEYIHFYEKEDEDGKRAFVPALLADNPYIHDSYLDSLARLDWVSREQLLYGHWLVRADGGIFKREWFTNFFDPSVPIDFEETVISVDMAFKDTKQSDFTVYQLWGRNKVNFYLVDQVRGKWGFPQAKAEFKKFCDRHPKTLRKIIEDKAAGISMIQDLKDEVGGLIPYNPGAKSKMERAQLVSPLFEARNVFLPAHRSWVDDYISEMCAFTGASNGTDDQVDATSQALVKMHRHTQKFYVGSF